MAKLLSEKYLVRDWTLNNCIRVGLQHDEWVDLKSRFILLNYNKKYSLDKTL